MRVLGSLINSKRLWGKKVGSEESGLRGETFSSIFSFTVFVGNLNVNGPKKFKRI
jgi:hypothetical protein